MTQPSSKNTDLQQELTTLQAKYQEEKAGWQKDEKKLKSLEKKLTNKDKKIKKLLRIEAIIQTINALSKNDCRTLAVQMRTSREGIKAYTMLTFGIK